jgi:hypothetical protein
MKQAQYEHIHPSRLFRCQRMGSVSDRPSGFRRACEPKAEMARLKDVLAKSCAHQRKSRRRSANCGGDIGAASHTVGNFQRSNVQKFSFGANAWASEVTFARSDYGLMVLMG